MAFSIVKMVRPVQSKKALVPIVVILLPMVTLVKTEQSLKASISIFVTLLGMVTLVRPAHTKKAPSSIVVGKHDHKEESKRNYMLESLDVRFKKKIF